LARICLGLPRPTARCLPAGELLVPDLQMYWLLSEKVKMGLGRLQYCPMGALWDAVLKEMHCPSFFKHGGTV